MNLREETISSEVLYSGRVVTLRVDRVLLPNGKESSREVVVHSGAVAIVPMIDSETVILIKQFRQAAGDILLEIPAGTLEIGEAPEVCAHRELQEEIGYKPGELTLMFKSYLAPGYSSEMLHTFIARDLMISKAPEDKDEFIEIVQMPLAKALDLIGTGEIRDAKTICGLLMAQKTIA